MLKLDVFNALLTFDVFHALLTLRAGSLIFGGLDVGAFKGGLQSFPSYQAEAMAQGQI